MWPQGEDEGKMTTLQCFVRTLDNFKMYFAHISDRQVCKGFMELADKLFCCCC